MSKKTLIKCICMILGVIVIPLFYSFFYLGAFWDPYNTIETVPVAVVNNDKGAVINGETRNLGKEAADKLVDDNSLKFVLTDEQDAESGLNGTKYYAVITFPADFSENIASADTTNKKTAEVKYSANQKRNFIASQIMKTMVAKLEESSRDSISKQIVSTLSDKLNEVPSQLNTLNDGLVKLDDGAKTLSDGTNKFAQGQNTLTGGLKTFSNALAALRIGANDLNNGANDLNSGISTAASGAKLFSTKVSQSTPALKNGINSLDSGAQTLLKQFSAGTATNATIYDGVTGVDNGISQLQSSLFASGSASNPTVYDGITGVDNGISQLQSSLFASSGSAANPTVYDGVIGVNNGLKQLQANLFASGGSSATTVYDGVKSISSGASSYTTFVNNTLYTMIKSDTNASSMLAYYGLQYMTAQDNYNYAVDAASKAQYAQQMTLYGNLYKIYNAALNTNSESAFEQALANSDNIVSKGAAISAGAAQFASQFEDGGMLKSSVAQIVGGSDQLTAQFKDGGTLKNSVAQLKGASGMVASQFKDSGTLKSSVAQLKGASGMVASQFENGGSFKTGVAALASGTSQLSTSAGKLDELSNAANSLSSGLSTIESGSSKLADGSSKLAAATEKVQNGGKTLQEGSEKLASASNDINSGANKLASGISTAKDGVSDSITKAEKETSKLDGIDTYAEKSVNVNEKNINEISNYGTGFAPYFMSLSLYVGALIMFFGIYLDADERIKVLSRHSNNKYIRTAGFVLIGIGQAVALGLICQFALGLSLSNVFAFYMSCILISLVFISIVGFLIVKLGDIGKLLAMLLLVLQLTSNGGTFPMETVPKFFNALYPYMPMTYSVGLFKETITNFNSSTAWHDASVLIAIFVVFTLLTMFLSVTKKAKQKVEQKLQAQSALN
jgi:putative membrane protein